MAAQPNPAKIFIGNLPEGQPNEAIAAFFGVCGHIVEVELPEGRNYGWVTYSTPDSAERAIDELAGADFTGCPVRVEPFRPKPPRAPRDNNVEKREIPNSVFVGNLPRRMEDGKQVLEVEFGTFGNLTKVTYNRERGYGYVRYETPEAAQDAIKTKQGADIGGRPVRCEIEARVLRQRKPSAAKAPKAPKAAKAPRTKRAKEANPLRVFIGGLPRGVERETVEDLVKSYGVVNKCRFGARGQFAMVDFETADQASAAVKGLQGAKLGDADLRVEAHKPAPAREASAAAPAKQAAAAAPRKPRTPPNPCIVWVGGITREITEQHIRAAFASFGSVESVEMHTRHAFITFATSEGAAAAIQQPEKTIEGESVSCSLSLRTPPPVNPTRIFVGNLPEGITEEDVSAAFASCGTVTNLSIAPAGGSGYISFETAEAATAAVERMAGQVIGGNALRVEPARPDRKSVV